MSVGLKILYVAPGQGSPSSAERIVPETEKSALAVIEISETVKQKMRYLLTEFKKLFIPKTEQT